MAKPYRNERSWYGCDRERASQRAADRTGAIEQYLSARETAEILADPDALRNLAEARECELIGT
jgi:hypothetical protein